MKPDELEQKLLQQPLRMVPTEWRAEILAAARVAQPSRHSSLVTRHTLFSTLVSRLSTFLWPQPRAWAALAAAWVFIVVLNFSANDKSPARAKKNSVSAPEMAAELKQQKRFYAELMGVNEAREADRPQNSPPRPRTQHTIFSA
jgi:hypothetical protein